MENGPDAYEETKRLKNDKYANLAGELSNGYKTAVVGAIVVGALGYWDPANDKYLNRLVPRSYLKMMKTIISKTIAHTRDVFDEHTRRIPQDSHGHRI